MVVSNQRVAACVRVEAEGGWRSLCSLCAVCLIQGEVILLVEPRPRAHVPFPLTDAFMKPSQQEVLLSHHSGIIGGQGSEQCAFPSARVCQAGRGRFCWNVVCHCTTDEEECVSCFFAVAFMFLISVFQILYLH